MRREWRYEMLRRYQVRMVFDRFKLNKHICWVKLINLHTFDTWQK